MYVFYIKKKYESKILMSLSFVDMNNGIQIRHPLSAVPPLERKETTSFVLNESLPFIT
jgi:hypothetical protein